MCVCVVSMRVYVGLCWRIRLLRHRDVNLAFEENGTVVDSLTDIM